jgi:hypothetical protein
MGPFSLESISNLRSHSASCPRTEHGFFYKQIARQRCARVALFQPWLVSLDVSVEQSVRVLEFEKIQNDFIKLDTRDFLLSLIWWHIPISIEIRQQ